MTIQEEYTLILTKREYTLVTKALVGKLDPGAKGIGDEIAEAREFGLKLMTRATEAMGAKFDALNHALKIAHGEATERRKGNHEGTR